MFNPEGLNKKREVVKINSKDLTILNNNELQSESQNEFLGKDIKKLLFEIKFLEDEIIKLGGQTAKEFGIKSGEYLDLKKLKDDTNKFYRQVEQNKRNINSDKFPELLLEAKELSERYDRIKSFVPFKEISNNEVLQITHENKSEEKAEKVKKEKVPQGYNERYFNQENESEFRPQYKKSPENNDKYVKKPSWLWGIIKKGFVGMKNLVFGPGEKFSK